MGRERTAGEMSRTGDRFWPERVAAKQPGWTNRAIQAWARWRSRVSARLERRILEERDPIPVVIADHQLHGSIASRLPGERNSISLEPV